METRTWFRNYYPLRMLTLTIASVAVIFLVHVVVQGGRVTYVQEPAVDRGLPMKYHAFHKSIAAKLDYQKLQMDPLPPKSIAADDKSEEVFSKNDIEEQPLASETYYSSSRKIIVDEHTTPFEFSLNGRVFSQQTKDVRHNVSTSFFYSFKEEVIRDARTMIPFVNGEADNIFATAPAFTWCKGKFYAVVRTWLVGEVPGIRKKKKLNLFQNNFLYAQTYDQFMKPLASGRLLGVPVPLKVEDVRTGPVDPRLVTVGEKVFLIFYMRTKTFQVAKALNAFVYDMQTNELARPTIDGKSQKPNEKNWGPFDIDGILHFVYTMDPLRIIKCGNISDCKTIYVDDGVDPKAKTFNSRADTLRGGTQFELYRDNYYIGLAHSTHLNGHIYAHLVLMRINPWRIVYVSDVIQMGREFTKSVKYVVPWMKGPFLFPVGLNVPELGGDVLDVSTNVADAQSRLMRMTGLRKLVDDVIEIDSAAENVKPSLLAVQNYVRKCAKELTNKNP